MPPVVVNAKGVKVPFSTSIILDAYFRFFSSSCNLYINNTNNNNTNTNNDNNKLKVLKRTNSGRFAEHKAADLLIPSRCGTSRAQEMHKSSSNEFRILYQ